ncbi:MAG: hypothetical protein ACRECH_17200, partial [Nitrososphaerales archaeon]
IIQHEETGYLVRTLDEMKDSVKRIDRIDPWKCRQLVLRNFDVPILADNYLNAYGNILSNSFAAKPELLVTP